MQEGNNQNSESWSYHNEGEPQSPENQDTKTTSQPVPDEPVTWTASEFIAHHKNGGWYVGVVLAAAILCALIFLITHDIISVVAISIAAILFLIVSAHKPKQQQYTVNLNGISIGEKFYPYEMFKSFMVAYEGAIGSIVFVPLKRFMPELTIYFAPDDEDRIIDVLAACLPNDQRKEQLADKLSRRIRF